jgi:transcriptional regulator with XRE-family HTH domain
MKIEELIAIAAIRSGKERRQLAEEMGIDASRLSKIAKGKLAPQPGEIIYLATEAKTDAMRALADIESEREPRFANLWSQALMNMAKL